MKKSQIIKNFNTTVSEFLEQLAPNIGIAYYHSFAVLIKVNCTEPILQFIKYIHHSEKPLEEYISKRNEEYFENTDNHTEYISTIENSNLILMEILKAKDIYIKLNQESKDNFWDILQVLLFLSNEYKNAKS